MIYAECHFKGLRGPFVGTQTRGLGPYSVSEASSEARHAWYKTKRLRNNFGIRSANFVVRPILRSRWLRVWSSAPTCAGDAAGQNVH